MHGAIKRRVTEVTYYVLYNDITMHGAIKRRVTEVTYYVLYNDITMHGAIKRRVTEVTYYVLSHLDSCCEKSFNKNYFPCLRIIDVNYPIE
jgi:hypothetical protein